MANGHGLSPAPPGQVAAPPVARDLDGHPARVLLASRDHGIHDRRFAAALEDAGLIVASVAIGAIQEDARPNALADAAAIASPDIVVAGPVLDVTLAAVRAGLRPLVGVSFAFDLLAYAHAPGAETLAREALAGCDGLVCDAHVVVAAAVALGMPSEAIICVPWGADLVRYHLANDGGRQRIRALFGWLADEFVILTTRSHEPLYRASDVIEAFVQAAHREERLRLLVLGDGSERPSLEAAVTQAGFAERVRFVGRIGAEDLPDWYAAADLYASGSLVDGSSVSLLEAMATGLPVVVPDVGGNPEWVIPGRTGWLVPTNDPPAMAAAMLAAAALGGSAREAMARAARADAEARADWRHNATRFAGFVARVARKRHH